MYNYHQKVNFTMSNRNRILRLFYYFTQNSGSATSEDLAKYLGVSVRTVKSEIDALTSFCNAAGCSLLKIRGKGYRIQIFDTEKFEETSEQISRQFSDYTYTTEYKNRNREIARELLVLDKYCKLDDLADAMFLSRSTIKNSIKEARKLLSSFQLEIKSKPGYGVCVDGLELNKRFCMLELLLNHDSNAVTLIQSGAYRDYFETDVDLLGDIRHAMLKVLRESNRTVLDSDTHRIVRYLSLMKNRHNKGYYLDFSLEYKNNFRLFSEYTIAKNIIESEKSIISDIPDDENEIMGLEVLLLFFNDPYDFSDISNKFPYVINEAKKLSDAVFSQIEKDWNVSLRDYYQNKDYLTNMMIPNAVRKIFNKISYVKIGKDIENNGISASPLSVAVAAATLEKIEYSMNEVHDSDILSLAIRLYVGIDRIRFKYNKLRILVASRAGKQACQIIIDKLINEFGKDRFDCIEPIGFYEVRRLNQEDYDWMIVNYDHYYYHYALPYIYVDTIPTSKQIDDIRELVIKQSYDLDPMLNELKFTEDFVFENFNYVNRNNFLTLLAMRNAKSLKDVNNLFEQLEKITDISVWQDIAFVIINTQYTKKNLFEIYSLEKRGEWIRKEVKYIVFISVEFGDNPKVMKYIEKLTNALAVNPDTIQQIIEKKSLSCLSEIVRTML